MNELHSDELLLKLAAVLREYENAHPDVDVRIDLATSMGSTNCGARLMSASHVQMDLDRLRRISDPSTGPPEQFSDHLTGMSNAGHEEPALVLAKEVAKTYPSDPNAHKWLAEAYFGLHMKPEAVQSFNEAIGLAESPEWLEHHDLTCAIDIRWAFGGVYVLWGDLEAAREQLSRARDAANSLGLSGKAQTLADRIDQYCKGDPTSDETWHEKHGY